MGVGGGRDSVVETQSLHLDTVVPKWPKRGRILRDASGRKRLEVRFSDRQSTVPHRVRPGECILGGRANKTIPEAWRGGSCCRDEWN